MSVFQSTDPGDTVMVMGLFSVFWLSFGVIQLPTLNLSLPYATTADPTGATSPAFNTDVGLYLLVWGFALFTFFIFTLKINTVFALIFGLVSTACWILSAACEFAAFYLNQLSPEQKRPFFQNETKKVAYEMRTIRCRRVNSHLRAAVNFQGLGIRFFDLKDLAIESCPDRRRKIETALTSLTNRFQSRSRRFRNSRQTSKGKKPIPIPFPSPL